MALGRVIAELRRAAKAFRKDVRHQLVNSLLEPLPMTPARVVFLGLLPEMRVTAAYRFYNALHRAGYGRLATVAYLRTKLRFGCDLHPAAEIGPGLRIVHAQDLVIGPEVRIGSDLILFNGVTLGNKLGRNAWLGMPTVGDGVILGTGAKLLGPIAVGDGARVGANAVVLADVPEGGVAVGVPARVVTTSRADERPTESDLGKTAS